MPIQVKRTGCLGAYFETSLDLREISMNDWMCGWPLDCNLHWFVCIRLCFNPSAVLHIECFAYRGILTVTWPHKWMVQVAKCWVSYSYRFTEDGPMMDELPEGRIKWHNVEFLHLLSFIHTWHYNSMSFGLLNNWLPFISILCSPFSITHLHCLDIFHYIINFGCPTGLEAMSVHLFS
jgi:hypothetical protein